MRREKGRNLYQGLFSRLVRFRQKSPEHIEVFDTSGHKRLQRRQYHQDEFLHHLCQQCCNSYGINHSRPGDHCLVNLYRNAGLAGVPGTSKVATGKDKLGMIASLADMHARISQRPPNVMVRKPKHQSTRPKCARGLYTNNQDKRSCSMSRWKGIVRARNSRHFASGAKLVFFLSIYCINVNKGCKR